MMAPAPNQDAAAGPPQVAFSLSWRLLVLTVVFVMLAEILILFPSLARFRVDYLQMKLADAHLVLTALEASTGQIDPMLRDRLLAQAGMLGMTATRPNMPTRTLGPNMPPRIPMIYDLREAMAWDLVIDAVAVMARTPTVMGVTGYSPTDPAVLVEVVIEEQPLCDALWDYFWRIFALSLFISLMTAALVYAALQWLAVRPLKRITASMIAFQRDPADLRRIITPDRRTDEVGVAEHALADMQRQLRASLLEKERLAGVGAAVTKISHDLKNILATAMLESDRLESIPAADPEVKQITAGIVRAIDRAVKLSTSTLRFAKEDLPQVHRRWIDLHAVTEEACAAVRPAFPGARLAVAAEVAGMRLVDAELLHRTLENLLRNACEAGATVVTVSLDHDGELVALTVADNGPGLARKALDNLFVPFTGSARPGGSGLGLPIARELMRAQGGDVTLKDSSPTGAVFAVRLPA